MQAKGYEPGRREFAPSRFGVLIVEDNELFAQAIGKDLENHGVEVDIALDARQAIDASRVGLYQVILLDHKLPDDDGIRIIPFLMSRQPHASVIVMTAYGGIKNAIQAIRHGAEDYVVKETSIAPIVERVLDVQRRDVVFRTSDGWDEHKKDGLIGQSPAMIRVRDQVSKVAATIDTTVLFTGETGVGKEVAARYLHRVSAPADSPFVSVDCVSLPPTLVESLLFGHVKGSFTDAHQNKKGVFHEAGRGTVLLDEIGDMDLGVQAKLLRVLETRRFQQLGSVQEHDVSARVVAATNRDLMELVKQGRFRFDLYQRLSVFPIHIPPLRERGDDILLAARFFVEFFFSRAGVLPETIAKETQDFLRAYDYPGNVRELKNILERAVILSDFKKIESRHLPERILNHRVALKSPTGEATRHAIDFIPGVDTIDTLEQKLIHRALKQAGGVKTEAARLLGISRYQLLRRMQKYGAK